MQNGYDPRRNQGQRPQNQNRLPPRQSAQNSVANYNPQYGGTPYRQTGQLPRQTEQMPRQTGQIPQNPQRPIQNQPRYRPPQNTAQTYTGTAHTVHNTAQRNTTSTPVRTTPRVTKLQKRRRSAFRDYLLGLGIGFVIFGTAAIFVVGAILELLGI